MPWIRSQQTGLVELLEKLAKLQSKLTELHVKQLAVRTMNQARMLQARVDSESARRKPA